jgi:hypothetical protein
MLLSYLPQLLLEPKENTNSSSCLDGFERTSIERWNNKIRSTRRQLKGWAQYAAGIFKKENAWLSIIIDELDKIAEFRLLTEQEIEHKSQSNTQLASQIRDEELK